MAELKSRQAANIAAGNKNRPASAGGKKRVVFITTPAVHALAQNDLLVSDRPLPVGTRFTADSLASHAALGSGVTVSIGIRDYKTKEVIDATAIASAVDVSSASPGRAMNNGGKVAAGIEYVTDKVTEVFVKFEGGNPTDNAQARFEIGYVSTD